MLGEYQNIEAEGHIIGAILFEPTEVLDKLDLKYTDYFKESHRYIVKCMQDLQEKNQAIDIVTVSTWLGERKLLEKIGGISYLSELAGSIASIENVGFYEKIVKKQAKKRMIQKTLDQMQHKLVSMEDEDEIDTLVSKGIQTLNNTSITGDDGFTSVGEVMREVMEKAGEERGDIVGTPTGYTELDRMLSGLKGGELIIIGARPSIGKTAFALNLTVNAGKSGAIVPVYSLEMGKLSLGQRILSSESHINSRNIRIGTSALTMDNWKRMTHEVGILSGMDILLNDTAGVDVNKIKRDLIKLRKDNPDREIVCFIDYLQLIKGSSYHKGNRTQELSEISRELKLIAKGYNICIVALSQLSRGVEQRQDKRPMMSDIRESGSIEQDADVVAFLYRDDYYDKESENKDIVECIIAKQRDGAIGTVSLAFVKEYGRFVNLERRFDNA